MSGSGNVIGGQPCQIRQCCAINSCHILVKRLARLPAGLSLTHHRLHPYLSFGRRIRKLSITGARKYNRFFAISAFFHHITRKRPFVILDRQIWAWRWQLVSNNTIMSRYADTYKVSALLKLYLFLCDIIYAEYKPTRLIRNLFTS